MLRGRLDRAPIERVPAAAVARRGRSDVAWLAVIPCALVVVAAVVLLAPPLSRLLYPKTTLTLIPSDLETLRPKPEEDTRYLIALCVPVLLTLATLLIWRGSHRRQDGRLRGAIVLGTQALTVGLIAACFVGHHSVRWEIAYFTGRTLVVAAAIAAVILLATVFLRSRPELLRPGSSRAARIAVAAGAFVAVAVWILPGIDTETSITWSLLHHDVAFQLDETFAVINGLTPLVDFHAQYASLLPYGIALSLLAFGKTVLVYTITVCALSVLAFCAAYDVLRRTARSSVAALLLFVPVLATSLFNPEDSPLARFSAGTYFPMFPFRYGGAYLLLWLVARRLDVGRRSRDWLLFAACGLVILNNFEFGVPAFGATVAALLATGVAYRRAALLRLARDIAIGLFVALATVSLLTLLRAGSLPDVASLWSFSRLYGAAGYSNWPLAGLFGLPLVIYLTYVAAIGTAVVRAINHAPNRVLSGMLMWVGLFGLGSATYYVARSEPTLMPLIFPVWALALALLTLVAVESIAADGIRVAGLPALAVLFGMGLAVCSIGQFPYPWTQLSRIHARPPLDIPREAVEWSPKPAGELFERSFITSIVSRDGRPVMRRGAPIALFVTTGHRIADAYGVVDVVPFTGPESMHTFAEYERALDALHHAGGDTVLLPFELVEALHEPLERRGFRILTTAGARPTPISGNRPPSNTLLVAGLTKWIDLRAFHISSTG
ncbi:MAG TPA: hypothetical protein VFF79_09710 [Conexibacter sp.]|jgi:hypothetical protein|nr:hypothetical protein [Conexibacter sp.]